MSFIILATRFPWYCTGEIGEKPFDGIRMYRPACRESYAA